MPTRFRATFSVLDLSPICEGSNASASLANTLDLAQHAEAWGYRRFWVAEHHGMPGIASAATAVVIGHVAGGTKHIRVGAGGIMLPNHSPLVIAEQFGTLDALYPGRIDLGLGRAPGTDQITSRALRRNLLVSSEEFPRDVMELVDYFEDAPGNPVRATPGAGANVPIWILGSSLFGAKLAASFGLPYAFASHFAPQQLHEAIDVYRTQFRPSKFSQKPYLMLGFNCFAAQTDEEAALLATSAHQAFVNLRRGRPGRLPAPVRDYSQTLQPADRALLAGVLSCSAIGSRARVRDELHAFIDATQPDELMIASMMYDHEARLRSYRIVSEVLTA